jgi:ubiquinone/menaquinone biosynthesis C-methylase UbiE
VLDVGCGPGTITIDFAQRVAPGRVVGIDRADEVLDAARADARDAAGVTVEFAVGDVYALDFPDGSYDVVHAHQALQHLTDPVAALREMRRVCAPGGVVAVRDSDYATFTWWPEDPRLTRWLELYHLVARSNDAEPDAGRRLLAWAHAAGFTDVEASASTWCFATRPDRAWWGGLWADRIVASAFAAQAIDGGLAARAELEEISAAWRSWSESPDAWFAIVHGELLARP